MGGGLGSARPELLLERLQHLSRVVLVGQAHELVQQELDLFGRGHQRRAEPLSGTSR